MAQQLSISPNQAPPQPPARLPREGEVVLYVPQQHLNREAEGVLYVAQHNLKRKISMYRFLCRAA